MNRFDGADAFVPPHATLPKLWKAAQGCTGCPLYHNTTQAVLGEGPSRARLVMVGEQPGDQEDLAGHPFVGPAGKLLDKALGDAGLNRSEIYVTNAVKHFKFEERGKRRIHKKPTVGEINACRPWLEAELALIKPRVIVCLGATAAHAVFGRHHAVLEHRGEFFDHPAAHKVTATVHPSAILRAPDADQRHRDYEAFLQDLKLVRKMMHE